MEPPRQASLDLLCAPFRAKVIELLAGMQKRGFEPVVFESLRTLERQKWLYGVGRTHDLGRKPVTWTMKSLHLGGKAVDIICKNHGWNDPKFFAALGQEARKVGLKTLRVEQCHVQG